MNKEQAIAALEAARLNSTEVVTIVGPQGDSNYTSPLLYNFGVDNAIEILRALPDDGSPAILAADEVETVEAIKVGDVIHADWWGDETHPDLTVVSVVTYLEVRDWRGLEHIGPLGGARLSQGNGE